MTAHEDARKAAEAATSDRAVAYNLTDVEHRRFVRDAVVAAAPILLAAERARIAAAIRAQRDLFDRADAVWIALDLAARIVEARDAA